ncbi:NAD(P)H-hydrate epimerase [Paenibacillus thiaminolyticus]|nr:NAD(P)H-hydrate epimerase [Paenibacillus thiaminolyticus]
MYIVTSAEMRTLDEYAIHTIGIPAAVLMENAGRAVAEEVGKLSSALGDLEANKPWLILTGKGNNGGDGMVAARHLRELGVEAELLYAADPAKLTSDAAIQRDIAARLGMAASVYGTDSIRWERYAGIVDALLGTGTAGAPREPYASLIREANASGLPMVAIDIPSGLDADTGGSE